MSLGRHAWAVILLVGSIAGAWILWMRRSAMTADPLAGLTVKGASVSLSNIEAIQKIQIWEFVGDNLEGTYAAGNPTMKGMFLTGKITFRPGDWYSLLPMAPNWGVRGTYRTETNEGNLMVPWESLWKPRTVTVGDADAHGIISTPVFARK